jgi:hypothetical protein
MLLTALGAIASVVAICAGLLRIRRELLGHRLKVEVAPGIHLQVARRDEAGEVTGGWACVAIRNTGGRPVHVERAGFRWFEEERTGSVLHMHERRAEIALGDSIELPVDSPLTKIYTPLGPLLACGLNPVADVEAFAVPQSSGTKYSPIQTLLKSVPSVSKPDQVGTGLIALRDGAERPPKVDGVFALQRDNPGLPEDGPPVPGAS